MTIHVYTTIIINLKTSLLKLVNYFAIIQLAITHAVVLTDSSSD